MSSHPVHQADKLRRNPAKSILQYIRHHCITTYRSYHEPIPGKNAPIRLVATSISTRYGFSGSTPVERSGGSWTSSAIMTTHDSDGREKAQALRPNLRRAVSALMACGSIIRMAPFTGLA